MTQPPATVLTPEQSAAAVEILGAFRVAAFNHSTTSIAVAAITLLADVLVWDAQGDFEKALKQAPNISKDVEAVILAKQQHKATSQ